MKIAILLGRGQYDATRIFSLSMGQAWQDMGHEIVVWDLVSQPKAPFDANSKIDAFFSINGPGVIELENGDVDNVYDEITGVTDISRAVVVWFLVDNPIDHYNRLKIPVANRVVLYVDESFAEFTSGVLRCETAADAFMPHAGMLYKGEQVKRDIEVLFTSSAFSKPELAFDPRIDTDTRQFISDSIDILCADKTHKGIWEAIIEVAAAKKYDHPQWDRWLVNSLVYHIDRYIRPYIKYQLLKFALDMGLKVHVYGNGWEEHPWANKLFGKKAVPFSETPLLNARAKIALNSNNNLTHGSHERVFNSMINGAIPLTDGSSYYDRQFPGVCLSMSDEEKIHKLLTDETFFEQESTAARRIALRGHTWAHRAATVEKMIKDYRKHVFGMK